MPGVRTDDTLMNMGSQSSSGSFINDSWGCLVIHVMPDVHGDVMPDVHTDDKLMKMGSQ